MFLGLCNWRHRTEETIFTIWPYFFNNQHCKEIGSYWSDLADRANSYFSPIKMLYFLPNWKNQFKKKSSVFYLNIAMKFPGPITIVNIHEEAGFIREILPTDAVVICSSCFKESKFTNWRKYWESPFPRSRSYVRVHKKPIIRYTRCFKVYDLSEP